MRPHFTLLKVVIFTAWLFPAATAQAGTVPPQAGLELWLRADQGVTTSGSDVTAWLDQSSGTAYDFAPSDTLRPQYVAAGLNGQPVVSFGDGGATRLTNASLDLGPSKTVFLVIEPDSLPADQNQRFFGHYGNGQFRYNTGMASGWFSGSADLADTTGIAAGKFATLAYRFDGNVQIGVNGRAPVQTLPSVAFTLTSPLTVGGVGGTGGSFAGDFAEVLVYDGAMDEATRRQVESYLAGKYFGRAVGPYGPRPTTAVLYHLDDAVGGTVAADASAHGLDLASSASPFAGNNGPANLGASAGRFASNTMGLSKTLNAAEAAAFDLEDFTIEAWVRNPTDLSVIGGAEHSGILYYRGGGGGRFQFSVVSRTSDGAGKLHLGTQRASDGAWYPIETGYLDWEEDTWYHLAVTYDSNTPAANDSIVKFYLTPIGLDTHYAELIATVEGVLDLQTLNGGGTLRLGNFDDILGRTFRGDLDEVRYTNAVLGPYDFNVAIVPEPAACLLLVIGAIALVPVLRRRRR